MNYWCLDAATIPETILPARMNDSIINSLEEAKVYSALVGQWEYWQVPIKTLDKNKTTFIFQLGTKSYIGMQFGFWNEHASFQRVINIILSGGIWKTFFLYNFEVGIFSKNSHQHVQRNDEVLTVLRLPRVAWKINPRQICVVKVECHGHIFVPGWLVTAL